MDSHIAKALHDKLYDKRKAAALDVEKLIRDSLAQSNHERIAQIVDQLCHDYAYAVQQPYARNGGLIGLAAASIALGPEVARYLEKIVPPVLACFTDQDARVRYYACESMYNIAKTSKGEILAFFNEIFDALAKLAADSEMSVKNGAELLDRLIKDIVSDSATTYVSMLYEQNEDAIEDSERSTVRETKPLDVPTAFSLPRFIPLLQERIYAINSWTRNFLVTWIKLLDSIPDLELISYLPAFLRGLFRFLSDPNQDVVTATQVVLEKFLDEIKLVAEVRRDVDRRQQRDKLLDSPASGTSDKPAVADDDDDHDGADDERPSTRGSSNANDHDDDDDDDQSRQEWVPGQDVMVDYQQILEILIDILKESPEEHVHLTALRWVDSFFDISPDDMLSFVPRILNQVLPALSSDIEQVRQAGAMVNKSLTEYILQLPNDDETTRPESQQSTQPPTLTVKDLGPTADRKEGAQKTPRPSVVESTANAVANDGALQLPSTPPPAEMHPISTDRENDYHPRLDYNACINALTLQFLNEYEATRIAALGWLILLQQKSPQHVLAAHDGTFPALLKTLSDSSDTVVLRDIQLLAQIAKHSDDAFFTSLVVNLLKLLCSDRRLLSNRSNMIIKQLCRHLSPERLYRTMAACLEVEDDVEFANQMVQHLNNNLITAPETADLRKKLRNWETRDGQTLFVALFKSWCNNAVATICLCLLAQGYEQAYQLLQTFADIEMNVEMLAQVDKLVQLLESPIFTFLRLHLLEPEKYPFLYKCLYGILMLLPQSAGFAALKNRLNSVSAIGYLHTPAARVGTSTGAPTNFDRANRLKSRDEGLVKWPELLDRFRQVQDRARRDNRPDFQTDDDARDKNTNAGAGFGAKKLLPPVELTGLGRASGKGEPARAPVPGVSGGGAQPTKDSTQKSKFGAGHFGRLAGKGKKKP